MQHTPIEHVHLFINFAAKELGLKQVPQIKLVGNTENKKGTFGHFIGNSKGENITVRATDRHPIDVMRTICHELIHYKQRMSGMKSSEMMKEDQANALAGRIMRKFDTSHPQIFNDKAIANIKEDGALGAAPANAMGASSSTAGSGPIDTIDPILSKKILKRKAPVAEGLLGVPSMKSPMSHIHNNVEARPSANKGKHGKALPLRKILSHETELEKRAETRIS